MIKDPLHKEFLKEFFQIINNTGLKLEPSYGDPTIPELRGYNLDDTYVVFKDHTVLTVGDYAMIEKMFPMVIDIGEIEYKVKLLSIMNEEVDDDRIWPASVAFSLTANGEPVSHNALLAT